VDIRGPLFALGIARLISLPSTARASERILARFTTLIGQRVRWALEKHDLTFPDKSEKFDFDREVVVFFGEDDKTCMRCAISREALDDDFGGAIATR